MNDYKRALIRILGREPEGTEAMNAILDEAAHMLLSRIEALESRIEALESRIGG